MFRITNLSFELTVKNFDNTNTRCSWKAAVMDLTTVALSCNRHLLLAH